MELIKPKYNKNFYVITGGPGVGKTMLLEELKNRNYQIVPEIARALIKEQQAHNGDALPWKNKKLYKQIMFDRSINSYGQTEKFTKKSDGPIFFDRGFLDTICYAKLIQSRIDEPMESYAQNWKYNKSIFILPPWLEIYETDSQRRQDWKEAVLTFEKMCETYKSYGYDVIEVPRVPVSDRADFILKCIKEK